jgi:hypothetical protein
MPRVDDGDSVILIVQIKKGDVQWSEDESTCKVLLEGDGRVYLFKLPTTEARWRAECDRVHLMVLQLHKIVWEHELLGNPDKLYRYLDERLATGANSWSNRVLNHILFALKRVPKHKKRGRPASSDIARQRKRRLDMFLSQLASGLSIGVACEIVDEKLGASDRTMRRDRNKHKEEEEAIEAYRRFGAWVCCLDLYGQRKGYRHHGLDEWRAISKQRIDAKQTRLAVLTSDLLSSK